jgi:hypothetical protein
MLYNVALNLRLAFSHGCGCPCNGGLSKLGKYPTRPLAAAFQDTSWIAVTSARGSRGASDSSRRGSLSNPSSASQATATGNSENSCLIKAYFTSPVVFHSTSPSQSMPRLSLGSHSPSCVPLPEIGASLSNHMCEQAFYSCSHCREMQRSITESGQVARLNLRRSRQSYSCLENPVESCRANQLLPSCVLLMPMD